MKGVSDIAEFLSLESPNVPGRSRRRKASRVEGMSPSEVEKLVVSLEEERFAVEAAHLLNTAALSNAFESLVVVAPPRTLGELRKHYHKEVEKRLVAEVPKDLTRVPVEEMERILQAQ